MWNMYWFPRAHNEKGNNLETLEVFVDHVIYRNESNGYCVLSADYEEEELIVTGIFQGDVQGAMLRVTGKMEYNANYGEQFKMQQYEIIEPTDAESIRRYLGSGAIKGIGESLAGRIVKRFGDDSLRIIEEEPERLAEVKGISLRKAQEIAEQVEEKKDVRGALMFLQKYGIGNTLAVRIYKTYGMRMYGILQENPYQMAEDIDGVGFRMADAIAEKIGIRTDSDYRIRSGILYMLSQSMAEGNLYLPKEELIHQTAELLRVPQDAIEPHIANLMMDTMLWPLQKPEDSVIVSIFTPCEMMQEVGLHPYNVEGFSCYLSASKAERAFLQQAENTGISETLCSYHKTFLGAAQKGLLPKPKCIVYTNLTCDANLLTFRTLADFYQVPVFAIDVPWNQTTENVQYVADQLKDLKIFLEKNTGKTISEDRLKERLACSKRTLENYKKYQQMRADRYVPSDLVTPLYAGMTNNILLGTAEEEKYTQMLLEDIKKAPAAKGKHIYWMHTIPFWSDAVRQELCFSEKAQIVGCELAETCEPDFDPENPFEAMAERMVYHSLNGSALRRIEAGIRHAKQAGADGAVWFGHWGCKHTLGAAQLAKKKFEEAGLPLLILDGDGCDRSHGGEGQTSTRLGAFLEMLGGAENE